MLDIRFVDYERGWAVGFNGFNALIFATHDGGQHWETQYAGSEITGQFTRAQFSNSLNGWVQSYNAVMQTEDGGKSWELRYFGDSTLNDIAVVGPGQAWVAGTWGYLLHTQNGVNWSQVPVNPRRKDNFLGYVCFVGTDRGWALGTKCDIFASRDAGKTWVPEKCPIPSDLRSGIMTDGIFRSPSKLYVIANPGYLLVRPLE